MPPENLTKDCSARWLAVWLVAAFVVWCAGAIGFARYDRNRSWIDAGLLSAQLFTLESNVLDRSDQIPIALELARIAAPLLTKIGLLAVICEIIRGNRQPPRRRSEGTTESRTSTTSFHLDDTTRSFA